MKIKVHVKPRSKQEKVEKIAENEFRVWVKELPMEGRANEAVIKALSRLLKIPKSRFSLVHGSKGKIKFFEF